MRTFVLFRAGRGSTRPLGIPSAILHGRGEGGEPGEPGGSGGGAEGHRLRRLLAGEPKKPGRGDRRNGGELAGEGAERGAGGGGVEKREAMADFWKEHNR